MRTRNKIIKEVIQCAETNGWHVDAEKHQDKNIVIFEFSQFTPAGQIWKSITRVSMQMRKPICGWTATDTAKTAHPTE